MMLLFDYRGLTGALWDQFKRLHPESTKQAQRCKAAWQAPPSVTECPPTPAYGSSPTSARDGRRLGKPMATVSPSSLPHRGAARNDSLQAGRFTTCDIFVFTA